MGEGRETCRVNYEKRNNVAYVTLNRPDQLNAMDVRMYEELALVWDDFEADDEMKVAVVTGAGERAFSNGQDLKERARLDQQQVQSQSFGSKGLPGWPRPTERFSVTKPTVARGNFLCVLHGATCSRGVN